MEQKTLSDLEMSIQEEVVQKFDATCVRKKSNIGKTNKSQMFDSLRFNSKTLLNEMGSRSPKLTALLKKIHELDAADMKKHGKLFKHFIFSDLKMNSAGAKLMSSALISKGLTLGYGAKIKGGINSEEDSENEDDEDEEDDEERTPPNLVSLGKIKKGGKQKKKIYEKIEFLSNQDLEKTKNNNFYLLCSSGVYDQPISVSMKKEILKRFNERPENSHGERVRFIVMDSGYKEGM